MNKNYVLIVENLKKDFYPSLLQFGRKKVVALDNVSFKLKKGEILGFLGPNGSGKTTTIQILLNLMTPTSGKIEYFGRDFFSNVKDSLKNITFASSYVRLPGSLTIYQNLDFFGKLYGLDTCQRYERIKNLLITFDLWQFKNRSVNALSSGQAARVMLAKAFLPNPKIVLLDEPTAALDPKISTEMRKFILNQSHEHNVSILFTSHNMAEVTELCDRILVLKNGKIIADNKPKELARTVHLARVHLLFENRIDDVIKFLKSHNFEYIIEERTIEIDIDEHKIPALLNSLALSGLHYINVSIDKPTLEDYFLSISSTNGNSSW